MWCHTALRAPPPTAPAPRAVLPTQSRTTHGAPIQKRQLRGANAARDETSHACRSLRPAPNPELPERGRSGGLTPPPQAPRSRAETSATSAERVGRAPFLLARILPVHPPRKQQGVRRHVARRFNRVGAINHCTPRAAPAEWRASVRVHLSARQYNPRRWHARSTCSLWGMWLRGWNPDAVRLRVCLHIWSPPSIRGCQLCWPTWYISYGGQCCDARSWPAL